MQRGEKMSTEMPIIPSITNVTAKPVNPFEKLADQDKHFNLFVSQDRNGTVFHELCVTTGNIDSCRIGNLQDAENIMNSGQTFKIAQPDPNLPNHLKLLAIA
jgi:hypothetical protein